MHSDGEPGTVYPDLWDEQKRAHLVRNVPADAAEDVAIASDMFSVTRRVWKIERQLGVASTFLLGAAKALEAHAFFHEPGDISIAVSRSRARGQQEPLPCRHVEYYSPKLGILQA